jgi:hypothetical protein
MQETKGCKKCSSQKGIPTKQIWTIALGTYVLFSAIYGTVVLFGKLIDLIK